MIIQRIILGALALVALALAVTHFLLKDYIAATIAFAVGAALLVSALEVNI